MNERCSHDHVETVTQLLKVYGSNPLNDLYRI